MLIRAKYLYDNSNIVELMKISEQDFVAKLGISMSKLEDERNKYLISDELDFRRNKSVRNCDTPDKIKRLADGYRKH